MKNNDHEDIDVEIITYATEQARGILRDGDGVCRTCLGQGFFGRFPHMVECSTCGGKGRTRRPRARAARG